MWLCHVTRRNIIVMLQLLCFLPEQMIHIRAHYVCEVGQEKDRDGIWRWVLPYQHPCKCTSIRFGGMNIDTPDRPFDPVYVDKALVGDNIQEIREHYHLDCIDPSFETCPADFEIQTDMGKPTGMVVYNTPPASDNSGYVSVMCEPPSGSDMRIGQNRIRCEALDSSQNSAICEFQVVVRDVENPLLTNCPEPQVHTDPGNSTAVVTYKPPTATDNSGEVITATCAPASDSEFAIGQTYVTCTARDDSGNTATCEFIVEVTDVENPLLTNCPEPYQVHTDPSNSTAVVAYQPPTATDNSGEVITVTCAPASDSEFYIGQTYVTCTARDDSGNTATCEFTVKVTDVENPVLTNCPEPYQVQTDPGNSTAVVTYQPPTATDNSGEVTIVTCAPPSASEFAIGKTNVTCIARDGSGNNATCRFEVDVKDVENPFYTKCPEPYQVQTDPGHSTAVVTYHQLTATDNSGEVIVTCEPASESKFEIGQDRVICTAQDISGNNATCRFTVEVIDGEAPLINCTGDLDVETDPGNATAVVTYQVPDATDNSGQVIVTCAPPTGSDFAMGQTSVTCTAQDGSGNNVTCEFTVDVKDKEDPMISSCPGNLKIQTNLGNSTAVVTYPTPTATDNSDEVNVSCAPPSESEFAIGYANVTCTAQDGSGNTATCEFMTEVKDEEDPMISPCPDDLGMQTDPGKPTTVVVYQAPTATDNSGEVIVTCTPPSESEFDIGSTSVTCIAQDGSGNSATCDFTVNMKDDEDPVISTCPGHLEMLTNPGKNYAEVEYEQPTATDNSGHVTVSCPSKFYMWQTILTCTAKDNSGNTATCRFTVNVKDEEPPVIRECYANYDFHDKPGSSTARVTYQLPNTFDNSRQVSFTCDPPSGTDFAIGTTNVTCLAKDSSGNNATNTCEFQVYIRESCRKRLGVEDGGITEEQLTSSTEYYIYFGPSNVRLNHVPGSGLINNAGAWRADIGDHSPWIQASLGEQKWVTGVLLQGRQDKNEWVTKFKVEYSDDEVNWSYVLQANDQSDVMIFYGTSNNRNTVNTRIFEIPIKASVIRIHPTEKYGWYSLRFELLGCELSQLSDTSSIQDDTECYTESNGADYRGAVSITETGKTCQKWTSQTPHSHSRTPVNYPDSGLGDHNNCRNPDNWYRAWCYTTDINARWEHCDIGNPQTSCIVHDTTCRQRLGVEDGRITDDKLTASTAYYVHFGPSNARLNHQPESDLTRSAGAWRANVNDDNQWIQASLGVPKWVTGVLLQGRQDKNEWVTKFKVEYSNDEGNWSYVQQANNQGEIVFDGNTNQNSVVTRFFPAPIKASFIRIRPTAWRGHISLRFELRGCEEICRTGWPVVSRAQVDIDSPGYTMVSPDKKLCNGQVTKWTYLAKQQHPFRAIVFRPIPGSNTQFQIVGINYVPAGEVDVPVTYDVTEPYRITVAEGDVIGWSFGKGVIAFDYKGNATVRWVDVGMLFPELHINQTLDINDGHEARKYSIEATVG